VKLANRQVWRRSEEAIEYLGMGTTITAVLLDHGSAAIANIGDSRVYLWRAGNLEQLSVDDTVDGAGSTGGFSVSMIRQPMLHKCAHSRRRFPGEYRGAPEGMRDRR